MSDEKPKEKIQLDPRTKAVFDRKGYEVQTKISEGAFGKVYKALRTETGKMAAVKVMDTNKMSPVFKERFLPREIKMMVTLRHPHILKVHDIFKSNHRIYIFMEFAPNGTLDHKIREGPLEEERAKKWFRQVSEALKYMHFERNICHRDIKPDNVLFDSHNQAKLSDFGFAKPIDDPNRMTRTTCGTIPYYSPELLSGQKYEPFLADCWAMGVMLYQILTAKLPFFYSTKREKQRRMIDEMKSNIYKKKAEYRRLSRGAQDLIDRLLVFNYERRMNVKGILKHPWITGESLREYQKRMDGSA